MSDIKDKLALANDKVQVDVAVRCCLKGMKRFSPSGQHYPDPTQPPDDVPSAEGHNITNGSKKVKTTQSFESLFDSDTLCDIILNVNDGQFVFKGHKMILGMKSEVLAAMLNEIGPTDSENRPILCLHESLECSLVFSRFLYFIYSGAVWLHRDYVLPLHKLAEKYAVKPLMQHCQSYITQILQNMLSHDDSCRGFPVDVVCDMYEGNLFSEDHCNLCFKVLCAKFRELITGERWKNCSWHLVCDLLKCDECHAEENVILTSATDWMKKNNLSDKNLIEDILVNIRYPLLHRKVLYHLQKHGVFKNFPQVQDLVENAVKYHCFKDIPEAKEDFVGIQFRRRKYTPRPGSADGNQSPDPHTNNSLRTNSARHDFSAPAVFIQNTQPSSIMHSQIYSNFLERNAQRTSGSPVSMSGLLNTMAPTTVVHPNSSNMSHSRSVTPANFVQSTGVQTGERSS